MKRAIIVIAVIGLIVTIGSDISRYVKAARNLDDATYDLAQTAERMSRSSSRDQVASELVPLAAQRGVRVYQYDQNRQAAMVWTQADVKDTYIIGGVYNLTKGMGLSQAFKTPFVIRDYSKAGI